MFEGENSSLRVLLMVSGCYFFKFRLGLIENKFVITNVSKYSHTEYTNDGSWSSVPEYSQGINLITLAHYVHNQSRPSRERMRTPVGRYIDVW